MADARWIALVPALPLAAAAFIALFMLRGRAQGDAAEPITARVAMLAAAAALLLMLALDALALLQGLPPRVELGTWLESGSFRLPLSFTLDTLSLSVGTLVALVTLLTLSFSTRYMHREAGFHRFFFAMCLFGAGMLLLVLAGNAVFTFTGWELAGASSYLLIGYAYDRETATTNALRAFVTNRVGDAGFLLGILLAASWLGTVEWPALTAAHGLETLTTGLLALGFVVAAWAKSAQVPFAPWIARALEGPTPSSAVFYGSLMVHAGVYLVIRLEPLLVQTPAVMALLVAVGLLTALYGYLSGLVQTDVKSALIFAVTTQVGLMFVACGLGWFEWAAWHLALHAAWRAYQFLLAPSYMHMVSARAQPAPAWLRTHQRLYTAALQRFWLDGLGDLLLTRPARAAARDVRSFDDEVVSRLVGLPEEARAAQLLEQAGTPSALAPEPVIVARGLAGRLLAWAADLLHRFEERLVLQPGGGRLMHLLRELGAYLLAIETHLERPRYLVLMILATFAVIL